LIRPRAIIISPLKFEFIIITLTGVYRYPYRTVPEKFRSITPQGRGYTARGPASSLRFRIMA
jgi:hypothetical protein